ncbi:uncharacterized protein LOC131320375 [Rhododendron vialii]|uniref:uncharacterized protein LOC131320375 n=1 Tax=Rhododendron vialii TaxID=182163 RepID=UPI00265DA2A4|nr:uncharacterized protein LOC131320375 [Rhododendron vialii]
MAAPRHTGNSEEAIEESDGITSYFRGFSPLSPQYLIGSWLTTPPQAPPVFHPGTNISLKNWEDMLSFANIERSIQLRGNSEEAIEEAEEMTSCLWGSDHPSAQYLIGSWLTTPPLSPFMWSFDPPSPQYPIGSWSTTPPQSPGLCGFDPPSPQYPIGSRSTTSPQSPYLWIFDPPLPQYSIRSWSTTSPNSPCLWAFDPPSPRYPIGSRSTTSLQSPYLWVFDPPSPQYPIRSWSTTSPESPCLLWGFDPSSPQFLTGWQSTTPPQSPPVFLPWSGFRPWSNALSFANRERSMQLQQQLLEEWSDVFNCAAAGGIPQLQQLQYWIVGFCRQRYDYHDKLVGAGKPRTPRRMGGQNPCTAEATEEAEEGEAAMHRRHLQHRRGGRIA